MVKRCILIFFLAGIMMACERHLTPLEQYRDAILPGMRRTEVIELLQQTTWYHQECPRGVPSSTDYFVEDIFFFGSHKYGQAENLIVESKVEDGELIVYVIGKFEPYILHSGAYTDCVQQDRFED